MSAEKNKTNSKTNPHRSTRAHHANETAEDYVEAVFDTISAKETCRVQDLARRFDVSHVTVSRIVSRLCAAGLMSTSPYQPVELTKKGESLAKRVKKRHEIVYQFLLTLGVDEQTANIDSEGIEHHVSEATLAAMKKHIKKSAK